MKDANTASNTKVDSLARQTMTFILHWHNKLLFASLRWIVPIGIFWLGINGFLDFSTKLFAHRVSDLAVSLGVWHWVSQLIFVIIEYATILLIGGK